MNNDWNAGAKDRDRALQLIGHIYDGALRPHTWPGIVQEVVQFVGGTRGLLFTSPVPASGGGFVFPYRIPESFVQLWVGKYREQDVWSKRVLERGLYREGVTVLDLASEQEVARSAEYRDLARHRGIGRLCSGIVFGPESGGMPPTVCSVFRDLRDPRFSEEERDRMAVLIPHLSRAIGVMLRLRDAELKTAATLAALDRVAGGVLLLDRHGAVTFANRAARRLLDEGDGLRLRPRRPGLRDGPHHLLAHSAWDQAALESVVASCLRPVAIKAAHFSAVATVSRPSGKRPFVIQVAPLPAANNFRHYGESARAIAFLADPDFCARVDAELARRLYKLTAAEIRLVELLCSGKRVAEAADFVGISADTARTQLKAVFRKMGVSRQADLLRQFLALGSTQ